MCDPGQKCVSFGFSSFGVCVRALDSPEKDFFDPACPIKEPLGRTRHRLNRFRRVRPGLREGDSGGWDGGEGSGKEDTVKGSTIEEDCLRASFSSTDGNVPLCAGIE